MPVGQYGVGSLGHQFRDQLVIGVLPLAGNIDVDHHDALRGGERLKGLLEL